MRADSAIARGIVPRHFPSFSEGLSLRGRPARGRWIHPAPEFPFLFGGTFIEGVFNGTATYKFAHFPSCSEGLSLRAVSYRRFQQVTDYFPSFSEGLSLRGCC